MACSPNARRARWDELLKENKGKIDVALAEKMLGDHRDTARAPGRSQRAHALWARGWIAARGPRVGLATLLSRRSGARKSDGRNDGGRNAHHGTHGASLRRGVFSPNALCPPSPGCLWRRLFF